MAGTVHEVGVAVEVGVAFSVEAVVSKAPGLQVHAFRRALDRLETAIGAGNADDVYISLTEATYWLATVAETDKSLKADDDVKAVVFVRGRLYHHTASPTYADEHGVWVWRPASHLPYDPKHRRLDLQTIYANRLEGRPITEVLRRFAAKF